MRLQGLYHQLVQRLCAKPGNPRPTHVLEDLIEELRQASTPMDDDVVCYVMALRILGGTIGQLTNDVDDPGYVNRASGATEGFYPRDLCGSAHRKQRGMATAVRTYEPAEFLAHDPTSTLAARADAFESALIALIQRKLAE